MLWLVLGFVSIVVPVASQTTGNNPQWDRWCGKAYQPQFPSFDPGGQIQTPPEISGPPQLNVQFKPRFSIYLSNEQKGEFVINAELSRYFGAPLAESRQKAGLAYNITLDSTGKQLAAGTVAINSTRNVVSFNLAGAVEPSRTAQAVVFRGWVNADGGSNGDGDGAELRVYTARTDLFFLPDKKQGSATRIDNLNGGLQFRNTASNQTWRPLLPYGYYASYDGFLGQNDTSLIQRYAGFGLNSMTPLTTYPVSRDAFAYMGRINLPFMYDLRDNYQNNTWVEEKVRPVVDDEALYSYWGGDEPDGHQHPFNWTVDSVNLIRKLDPYHPVAVTLNCQNYYFAEYSVAADFLMEDVYPIIANSTFSKWGTACNATYGDCGCDNCDGNVRDVSRRLEDLNRYERMLGRWPKTKFHNPQSFHGEGYWPRDPTPDEAYVMNMLAFNHGAAGMVSWLYPPTDLLATSHGELARVVTASPVLEFLVSEGDGPYRVDVQGLKDDQIDVAYWRKGDKEVLVNIVNPSESQNRDGVAFPMPGSAGARIEKVLWGDTGIWELDEGGKNIRSRTGFGKMSASLLLITLA